VAILVAAAMGAIRVVVVLGLRLLLAGLLAGPLILALLLFALLPLALLLFALRRVLVRIPVLLIHG
jgi:hypothetical protein